MRVLPPGMPGWVNLQAAAHSFSMLFMEVSCRDIFAKAFCICQKFLISATALHSTETLTTAWTSSQDMR